MPDRDLRVLAVHRYYWPDTPPYASILRSIAARWAADGHEVEVLSTQPSYKARTAIEHRPHKENLDGVLVRRLTLPREHGRPVVRLLNALLFSLAVVRRVLVGRYDVVMTSTSPPVLLGWAASWAARLSGARFVYHCMDIHPEIGRISGDFSHPLVYRLLRRLDRATCGRAGAVVVLSQDMAEAVAARRPPGRPVLEVINNFELSEDSATDRVGELVASRDRRLRVVFTGNIGRFQGLEAVVDALGQVGRPADVELVLMGEGGAAKSLRERAARLPDVHVAFLPHQDVATARALIRSADLCLVSLATGIHRYAYPSKTMTYLAEGRPLLVAMEPRSELVQMVDSLGVGVSAPPGDSAALARLLDELLADPRRLEVLKETAADQGGVVFDRTRILDRWSTFITRLSEGVRSP